MEITDEEFARIEPLLAIVRGKGKIDSRTKLNAMLFIAENTIAGADKILVLDDGRLVGNGNHAEFMKQNGLTLKW